MLVESFYDQIEPSEYYFIQQKRLSQVFISFLLYLTQFLFPTNVLLLSLQVPGPPISSYRLFFFLHLRSFYWSCPAWPIALLPFFSLPLRAPSFLWHLVYFMLMTPKFIPPELLCLCVQLPIRQLCIEGPGVTLTHAQLSSVLFGTLLTHMPHPVSNL